MTPTERLAWLRSVAERAKDPPDIWDHEARAYVQSHSITPDQAIELLDEIAELKAQWNEQAKHWNANTLADSREIAQLKAVVDVAREGLRMIGHNEAPPENTGALSKSIARDCLRRMDGVLGK